MNKCPECNTTAEFTAVGPYRSMCENCGAVVKNEELEKLDEKEN